MQPDRVGLVLSGGGMRALVFHLGVLKWIDEAGWWHRLHTISTVSGGSLAVAAVLAVEEGTWPAADVYTLGTLPRLRRLLTTKSLQARFLTKIATNPLLLMSGRAHVLASAIEEAWGPRWTLQDLPDMPEWLINTTCYETGKNWRFSKEKMGDYIFGYSKRPTVPVADAVAASAGFPVLIGPLRLDIAGLDWGGRLYPDVPLPPEFSPLPPHVTLWDGGVYENTGIEPLYKQGRLQRGIDFIVVSDAGAAIRPQLRRFSHKFPFYHPPTRLIDIATDQVRGLRAREMIRFFDDTKQGMYVRIGRSSAHVQMKAGVDLELNDQISSSEAIELGNSPTNLRRQSDAHFTQLLQHGFETARATFESFVAPHPNPTASPHTPPPAP